MLETYNLVVSVYSRWLRCQLCWLVKIATFPTCAVGLLGEAEDSYGLRLSIEKAERG